MPDSDFWDSYLSPGLDNSTVQDKFTPYKEGFSQHRETISRMLESLAPRSVAILGSGFLNDVPLSDLVQKKPGYLFCGLDREYFAAWYGQIYHSEK